jgi:molybdopterin synthase sulfur carrier subunit
LLPGAERALRRFLLLGLNVGEMIDALDVRWPGMRDRLCDSRPAIRRHVNVFVEGRRATLDTTLAPGTEVTVLTAISGG